MWFQSTRPCGARPLCYSGQRMPLRFQSTRPCGARQIFMFNSFFRVLFQSTRPCGARLGVPSVQTPSTKVSIHAPMRGATSLDLLYFFAITGFNPRAHAGRDLNGRRYLFDIICFNPRAHAGRDQLQSMSKTTKKGFNPRAHAGRDT